MYTIVLHPKNASAEIVDNDNYNERSRKTISPQLELEENAFGSLSFTLPCQNACYDLFETDALSQAEIRVYHSSEGDPVFRGRLLEVKRDSQMNRNVIFEGELAYLADTVQEPAEYKDVTPEYYIGKLLAVHNKKHPQKFLRGIVTVTDNDSADHITGRVNRGSYSTDYTSTTWSCMQSLVSELGGFFKIRWENGVRYLDYLKEHPDDCDQTIELGRNLLDYAEEWSLAELYTVAIPIGATVETGQTDENGNAIKDKLTIASVNGGSVYLEDRADIIQRYGRREKAIEFSGIADPYHLKQLAVLYLNNIQFDNMVLSLTALDLSEMGYDVDKFKFQSVVRANATPFGLVNKEFPITKMSIPLKDPSHAVYTMSTNTRGIRSISNKITDISEEAKDDYNGLSDEIDELKNSLDQYTAKQAGTPEDWIFGIPQIVYRVGERGSAYIYRGSFVNRVWDAVHASQNFGEYKESWSKGNTTDYQSVIVGWPELWAEDADKTMSIKHGLLADGETWDDISTETDDIRNVVRFNDKTAGVIPFTSTVSYESKAVYIIAKFKNPTECRNSENDAVIGYRHATGNVQYCIDANFALCRFENGAKVQVENSLGQGVYVQDGVIVFAFLRGIVNGTDHPYTSNLVVGVRPYGDDLGSHVYTIPSASAILAYDIFINHYIDSSTTIPSGTDGNEHSVDIVRIVECGSTVSGQITMDEIYDNVKWYVGRYISGTIIDGGKLPEDEAPSPDEGGEDNG